MQLLFRSDMDGVTQRALVELNSVAQAHTAILLSDAPLGDRCIRCVSPPLSHCSRANSASPLLQSAGATINFFASMDAPAAAVADPRPPLSGSRR